MDNNIEYLLLPSIWVFHYLMKHWLHSVSSNELEQIFLVIFIYAIHIFRVFSVYFSIWKCFSSAFFYILGFINVIVWDLPFMSAMLNMLHKIMLNVLTIWLRYAAGGKSERSFHHDGCDIQTQLFVVVSIF